MPNTTTDQTADKLFFQLDITETLHEKALTARDKETANKCHERILRTIAALRTTRPTTSEACARYLTIAASICEETTTERGFAMKRQLRRMAKKYSADRVTRSDKAKLFNTLKALEAGGEGEVGIDVARFVRPLFAAIDT